jgi:PAS domain S-box-containing protein
MEDDATRTGPSEELLHAILESTHDGILFVNGRGETTYTNGRFAEMWRIPDDILATRSDERLIEYVLVQLVDPAAFVSKVRELYGTVLEDFDTLRFKDGRVFERYSRPLTRGASPAGRVWSFRDVTERRQAQERVREAEFRYRTLVERIPAITYVDSLEGADTSVYVSPQSTEVLGYTPEEWISDPKLWERILHPEDRERELAASIRHHETGEPYRSDYRMIARDGRVKWVHDEAFVLIDEEGQARFCHGVIFDITERKRAEEAVRLALVREQQAARELRAVNDMKNTFLSAVSHELRTPLTTILGSALTLERQDADLSSHDAADLVRRLASNARKLDRLLSDLLDLDRLSRGIVEPKRRRVDVGELVREFLEGSEYLVGRTATLDFRPAVVAVDPAKVERIVENLVANTSRHVGPGAPIWIVVRPDGDGVLIAVEDEGPGVPAELREAIFEPFRQAPREAAPASPGVGIGLSLVAGFAELHGGRAWVEERPGGGSSFKVYLADGDASALPEF